MMKASFTAAKGHPKDYFVPNFGIDSDVAASQKNLKDTEGKLDVKMQASFKPPKGHPQDYFVPNFGVDQDIKDAQKSIRSQE